jgi:hypothetical protein
MGKAKLTYFVGIKTYLPNKWLHNIDIFMANSKRKFILIRWSVMTSSGFSLPITAEQTKYWLIYMLFFCKLEPQTQYCGEFPSLIFFMFYGSLICGGLICDQYVNLCLVLWIKNVTSSNTIATELQLI